MTLERFGFVAAAGARSPAGSSDDPPKHLCSCTCHVKRFAFILGKTQLKGLTL